jgi:hypothetical protein
VQNVIKTEKTSRPTAISTLLHESDLNIKINPNPNIITPDNSLKMRPSSFLSLRAPQKPEQ